MSADAFNLYFLPGCTELIFHKENLDKENNNLGKIPAGNSWRLLLEEYCCYFPVLRAIPFS